MFRLLKGSEKRDGGKRREARRGEERRGESYFQFGLEKDGTRYVTLKYVV